MLLQTLQERDFVPFTYKVRHSFNRIFYNFVVVQDIQCPGNVAVMRVACGMQYTWRLCVETLISDIQIQ